MANKKRKPVISSLPARISGQRADNPKLLVNQIVVRPIARKTNDIDTWRNALKSADMGRVKMLYDLFEDLLIDGVLSDALDKRISAVTNSELTFRDADGNEVPEVCELIDSPAWEELLTAIMQARFWGRAGIEFDFSAGFDATSIPFKHIKLDNSQILINEYDDSGVSYLNDDHLLIIGKKKDFGLLLKAAPFAIYKRGGYGDYAQWLEIFGMPQRIGKYSSYDQESRKLLEEAMARQGSASYIVVPKETDIAALETKMSNSGKSPFNEFRQACNEEMLITILGQTMTTVQGDKGARSLGEVHKQVEEGKNKSDMRFVQRVLNHYVLPVFERRGIPVTGGKFIFPKAAQEITVDEVVQLSSIMDIPLKYLHDKYSIPAPKDGEPVAGAAKVADPANATPKPGDPPPEPPAEPPAGKKAKPEKAKPGEPIKNLDRGVLRRIYDFFALAPAVTTGASNGDLLTLNDGDPSDRIIKFVASGKGTFYPDLFEFISKDLISALDHKPTKLADLGFTYNYQNDAFRTAQELNIFHFSAAKDLAEIQRLNELFRQSKSFSEFYKLASAEVDVFNKTWQKTEWETAALISASAENYNRLKGKAELFPYWEYKTVGDDRVRYEHQLLDGVILPYNDSRWDKIFPPNGWRCRCYVVPRLKSEIQDINISEMKSRVDAYFDTPDWKSAEAQGFGVNRALLPELFIENQMYLEKATEKLGLLLKDIDFETYGLKSLPEMRSIAEKELQVYTGTAADFFKVLTSEDGKIFFKDYNNRSVLFDEEAYLKGHAKDKYAERTLLLNGVDDTLKSPDEVWVNNFKSETFNQYVFLKYYQDKTIVVISEINEGTVYRVKTWFNLEDSPKSKVLKNKYRWGLLIKKPGV